MYNSNCCQIGHDLIDHVYCISAFMPEHAPLPSSHKMYLQIETVIFICSGEDLMQSIRSCSTQLELYTLKYTIYRMNQKRVLHLWYKQAPLSVVRMSVFRPSTISNNFSSETTGLIANKFHIQPPGPLGKKSCSNDLGHMTNMAMPIYGKNLKQSSAPEQIDQ